MKITLDSSKPFNLVEDTTAVTILRNKRASAGIKRSLCYVQTHWKLVGSVLNGIDGVLLSVNDIQTAILKRFNILLKTSTIRSTLSFMIKIENSLQTDIRKTGEDCASMVYKMDKVIRFTQNSTTVFCWGKKTKECVTIKKELNLP